MNKTHFTSMNINEITTINEALLSAWMKRNNINENLANEYAMACCEARHNHLRGLMIDAGFETMADKISDETEQDLANGGDGGFFEAFARLIEEDADDVVQARFTGDKWADEIFADMQLMAEAWELEEFHGDWDDEVLGWQLSSIAGGNAARLVDCDDEDGVFRIEKLEDAAECAQTGRELEDYVTARKAGLDHEAAINQLIETAERHLAEIQAELEMQ
jgi:hypothetical protein